MPVSLILIANLRDLGGGMQVRRLLPAMEKRGIGPFVFFEHFGPMTVRLENRHDVRSHPHIGLATVRYLFEGAIVHLDSFGFTQRIEPGAINLMSAGPGIVHSEHRLEVLSDVSYTSHGLQLWLTLPLAREELEPAFEHAPSQGDSHIRTAWGGAARVDGRRSAWERSRARANGYRCPRVERNAGRGRIGAGQSTRAPDALTISPQREYSACTNARNSSAGMVRGIVPRRA